MPAGDANKYFGMGTWLVQPDLNRLSKGDQIVTLEPRVMGVLVCLASRPGNIVSVGELLDTVWHGRAHADDTIYQAIAHLRKSLSDDVHQPRYIETVSKKGYRLICPVTSVAEDADVPEITLHSQNGRRHSRQDIAIFAGIAAVAVAVVLTAKPELWSGLFPMDGGPEDRSVAVLPFVDMSEDGGQQYLGDGVAEELIHVLSNLPDVRVTARTSSFAFRDSNYDVSEIGSKLNVANILEGSVRIENGELRVIAQLVEVKNGSHLWSQSFDMPAERLQNVQREIAVAVAQRLVGRAAAMEHVAATLGPVDDTRAYDYYLLGRHYLSRRDTASVRDQAADYFQLAIALEPGFARAYAGLGDALLMSHVATAIASGMDLRQVTVPEDVTVAIEQALALDPQLAEAHSSRGLILRYMGDLEGAEAAQRESLKLAPNFAPAYQRLAMDLGNQQQSEAALAALKTALELDPMSAAVYFDIQHILKSLARYEDAMAYAEQAVVRNLDSLNVFLWNAMYKSALGRPDEAIRIIGPLQGDSRFHHGRATILSTLVQGYLDLNDYQTAQMMVLAAEADVDGREARIFLHLALGQYADAADLVHKGIAENRLRSPWIPIQSSLFEMVIGHDDHARALYKHLAAINWLDYTGHVPWGYYPALNAAHLFMKAGEKDAAAAILDTCWHTLNEELDDPLHNSGGLYLLASIHAINRETDAALQMLEQAIAAGWNRHWLAVRDPNLASLRGNSKFQKLIGGVKEAMEQLRRKASVTLAQSGGR